MNLPSAVPSLFLVASIVLAAASAAAQEPPKQARLTIDGDVYNVPLSKAFAVRIGGKKVTVRIDPQTDRTFSKAGVSFDYPMSLTPDEQQGGKEVAIWSMQGQTAAIMLQKYNGELDPKSLQEVLVENMSASTESKQTVKLTGAERSYQGVQIRTKTAAKGNVPATEGVQNIFTFANQNGVFALLVQEVHAAGAKDSKEYTDSLRLLGETLKTGKAPAPQKKPAATKK